MSDSKFEPWSDNPNAPKIQYHLYLMEKTWFAGTIISFVLYGMLTFLCFKCMTALFNPANHRGEGIKWGLVSYTIIMFSLATVHTVTKGHILSISYIDNRDFPGGPYHYQDALYFEAISIVSTAAFCLNNWSADGLLLYRCYVFYSRNLWVIAFPFFIYLGSIATGILVICPTSEWAATIPWSSLAYISISLSLNILLTLMIVVRLVLRGRSIRAAMGSPTGISGLYKTTITILVESSALFAVSSLLVIIPRGANSPTTNAFLPILSKTQVIASLLIIQRVANKSAFTSNIITPGRSSPSKASSQGGLTSGSGTLLGGNPMRSVGEHWTRASESVVGDETVIDVCRDKV